MAQGTGRFWLCPSCGRHVPARLPQCRCGASQADQRVAFESVGSARETSPSWFAVGVTKLVVMSLATLGLYQIYWFYQHWRRVRDGGEKVSVLARSVFGVISAYSLFRRVADSAPDDPPAASPGLLAVLYAPLCMASNLPMPFGLVAVLSVLPLVAIQRVANGVAERDFPAADPNRRLTVANWAAVLVGGAFLGLVFHQTVLRDQPTSVAFLSKVAARANQAPRVPKNGTVLNQVVALEGTLVYHYTVDGDARARLAETDPSLVQALAKGRLCRDPLLKAGVTVRYVYSDTTGRELVSVDIAPRDCR
jgi:hypothetical protein